MPSDGFTLDPLDYSSRLSTMQLTTTESDIGIYRKNGGRTVLEKILIFLVILTLAAAIAACIAIAVVAQNNDSETATVAATAAPTTAGPTTPEVSDNNDMCLTPGCVAAAARVNEYINPSVHPCDNFFEYACGNWIKKHPIPEDRSSIDTFGVLRDEVEVILKDLLEQSSPDGENPAISKAKRLYASCTNESQIEELGLDPLHDLFNAIGSWPLISATWNESNFDLIKLLTDVRQRSYQPLIRLYVSTDAKDSSARIIYLDQPSLIMPGRDYYNSTISDKGIPALTTFIRGVAEALGGAGISAEVDELVEFERVVAEMTIPSEDRRDSNKLYNKMTIAELSKNISDKFDWSRYIHAFMDIGGITIDDNEPVVIRSPDYLRNLIEFLETSSTKTVTNYIMSFVILDTVEGLPSNIRDLDTAYRKDVFGSQTARARWRTCVDKTRTALGDAVGRMFVDAEFDEDAKSIALNMINNTRTAFNELLQESEWMDDVTKGVAEEKAEAIGENIGYSDDKVKNDTNLEDTYKDVDFTSDEYFKNTLNALKWGTTKAIKDLRNTVRKDEWSTSPAIVNAFYSSSKNYITFPAAILQPPFFSKNYPKSMNYGGIGLVIGHEITHGFDDRGRQYDKNGDLKDWWTEEVIEKFKAKAQCIVDQYGDYVVPEADMKLNGVNTQGENIADNGGLKQSYTAYREWVRSEGKEEPKLPGVDLNHSQLFFINFAQIWCSTMRRENAINRILTGVHSPGRFRVIGSLHNSVEFSEVFNCPQTSYMNPEKKCRVW